MCVCVCVCVCVCIPGPTLLHPHLFPQQIKIRLRRKFCLPENSKLAVCSLKYCMQFDSSEVNMAVFTELKNIYNNKSKLQYVPNNGFILPQYVHSAQVAYNHMFQFKCIIKVIILENLVMKNGIKLSVTCIILPVYK